MHLCCAAPIMVNDTHTRRRSCAAHLRASRVSPRREHKVHGNLHRAKFFYVEHGLARFADAQCYRMGPRMDSWKAVKVFLLVVNTDHSSKLLSFWGNCVLCMRFSWQTNPDRDRRTDRQTDSIIAWNRRICEQGLIKYQCEYQQATTAQFS